MHIFTNINIKRLIILLLILGLIGEIIWAANLLLPLTKPISLPKSVSNPSINYQPTIIKLTAQSAVLKVSETVKVSIGVYSPRSTSGTDVVIRYDPKLLAVQVNQDNLLPVRVSSLYNDFSVNRIDRKSGQISVSGITDQVNGVIPSGELGFIVFKAIAAGDTKVSLDFSPGSTIDSNMIDLKSGKDILEQIQSLDLKISK